MFKTPRVAMAIRGVILAASMADQVRLGAQSGTSVAINEFRTRGPSGGNDEFVELFRPTSRKSSPPTPCPFQATSACPT